MQAVTKKVRKTDARQKTDFGKSAGLPEGGGANRVNLYNLLDPILSDRRERF